jgi:hypothetical protein
MVVQLHVGIRLIHSISAAAILVLSSAVTHVYMCWYSEGVTDFCSDVFLEFEGSKLVTILARSLNFDCLNTAPLTEKVLCA